DWEHGNVAEAWYQMGAPLNITREQTAELRHVADGLHRSTLTVSDDGVLDIDLTLPAWAVASVAPTLPGGQRPDRGGDEPGRMRPRPDCSCPSSKRAGTSSRGTRS